MTPVLFAGVLIVLSLAMVLAMVRYLAEDGRRWGFVYACLWIASVGAFVGLAQRLDPVIAIIPVGWLIVHWVVLRYGPTLRRDGSHGFIRLAIRTARWIVTIAAVLIVIGIGEALSPLHRFDEWLEPHRATLQIVFCVLLATGFVMFMGGVIHLAVTSRSRADGTFAFGEVRRAWREGTWRVSVRMRRFFLIAGGVVLALLAGAALAIVSASPGIKLLVILAAGYVVVRFVRG